MVIVCDGEDSLINGSHCYCYFSRFSGFLIPLIRPFSVPGVGRQDGFTNSQPREPKSTYKGQFIQDSNILS